MLFGCRIQSVIGCAGLLTELFSYLPTAFASNSSDFQHSAAVIHYTHWQELKVGYLLLRALQIEV